MESILISKLTVQEAIESRINDLCIHGLLQFNGQTKKRVLSQEYELKKLNKPSIILSEKDYKLGENVVFTGSGEFVFIDEDGNILETGVNEYSFKGTASLALEKEILSAFIINNTITVTSKIY